MTIRASLWNILGATLVLELTPACAKVTVLDDWLPTGIAGGGAAPSNGSAGSTSFGGSSIGSGGAPASGGTGPMASGGTLGTLGTGGMASGGTTFGGTNAAGSAANPTQRGGSSGSAQGGSNQASGGTTTVGLPYRNDFEGTNALANWLRVDNAKVVTTQWSVVADPTNAANHALQVGPLSDDSFEVGGNAAWTDQSVEVEVQPTSTSGYLYVAVRYAGVNSYYFLQLQAGGKPKIRARTNLSGSTSTTDVCAGTLAAGKVGVWSTVIVTAKGSTISASVDGTVVCTGTNSDIPAGGIALGSDGVQVYFDDLNVTLPP